MAAHDRHRCRWHNDNGHCPNPRAFPGVPEVPELCTSHLAALEPWVTRRASHRAAEGQAWITWIARKAEETQDARRLLGDRP